MLGATSYEADRDWADGYRAQVSSILRQDCAAQLIEIQQADEESDRKRSTDFVVRVAGGEIAVRVRSDGRDFRDVTIRSRRRSGARTELAKIREGFARWYLYCWTAVGCGPITEFVLLNLDRCRELGVFMIPRREYTADGGETHFIAINLNELRDAGCVSVDRVRSACPPPRAELRERNLS